MGVSCGFCLGEHGLRRLLGQRMIAGLDRGIDPYGVGEAGGGLTKALYSGLYEWRKVVNIVLRRDRDAPSFPTPRRAICTMPQSMPPLLVKAHQALDRVVDSAHMDAKEAAGRKPPKQCSDAKAYDLSVRALPATRLHAACCQAETRRAQEPVEVDGVERRSVAWMRRLGTLGKESDPKFS